jgi:sulfatase maturation enzyme AslB (radical SAM superfamily)
MTEARAEWLARTFDLIELACDGPNEIQSAQLPARSRIKNINPDIERTAQLLHEAGKTVHARVTITKESVNRQAEICQYICEKLYAQEIHVEPVYHPGRTKPGMFLDNDQVEPFIEAFFKAQSVAVSYRGEWKMPGSRLSEIHAARCNIFQQVLNLVPGDAATTCFKITSAEQARQADLSIGRLDPKAHIFVLDDRHTRVLRAGYTRPADCNHCLIEYQCTHNCPNGCPLLKQQAKSGRGGNTLCKILKKAASQQLIQLSGTLEVTPANPAARLNISIA